MTCLGKHLISRPTIFLAFIFLFLFACSTENKPTKEEKQVGSNAPLFTLNDLEGKPFPLADQKGKVVLIRFWSTQCKSCKEEMPKLEAIYQKLKPSGMTLVAINIKDTAEETAAFIEGMGLTFPILIDEGKKVAKEYKVFGVPTSFLIDKEGTIRERFFGDLSETEIDKLVRPLL